MDKLTSSVLAVVNAQTNGAYKVMEAKDFIDALPEKTKTDETGVSNALQYLAERGFIDIRYSERNTYCVCSLPKGRTFEESTGAEKARGRHGARNQWLITFFGAMLGAFAGGCLAGLLFLLL